MKKAGFAIITIFVLMAVFINPLYSLDLGLYATASGGSGSAENYSTDESEDQSSSGYGFGLIATGHFGNFLINRFMLMYDYNEVDVDGWGYYTEYYIDSTSVYDTIGLVIYSTQSSEIWLGPQIGLFLSEATDYSDREYNDGGGASFGAVIGLDVSVDQSVVLGAEAGIRYRIMGIENDEGAGSDIYSLDAYLGMSLMLRI